MLRLKADSENAAHRFLDRVAASRSVWLLDDEGFIAGCNAHLNERFVVPFFSDRAYAVRGNRAWGSRFVPCEVTLEHFLTFILPEQIELQNLIGLNWDAYMAGVEWEPDQVLADLNSRCSAH